MKEYFELKLNDLMKVVDWSLPYVASALEVFEKYHPNDNRPRRAVQGANEFSASGKRTQQLRKIAMDAYRASRESSTEQASFAANAASLLAAVAYTHPFKDPKQARHIIGPVTYAVLALEREDNELNNMDIMLEDVIKKISREVVEVLSMFPRQVEKRTRIDEIYLRIDREIMNVQLR